MLADIPENVRAFEWIEKYARAYGVEAIDSLSASFGNFGSAQNPFMSETLAMVFQGVWMANYIEQYAPKLEWAATPFPVEELGDPPGLGAVPFGLVGLLGVLLILRARREARRLRGSVEPRRDRRSLGLGLAFVSPWAIGLLVLPPLESR